ncbi:uncharacterized protein GGS25DRAFT_65341 [Hypoxylon fragiforme]|uniref:uncharacterized protein n=1 Tax=Hypoxylon fragiforme TaxID=63214 RepID=UPI0020C6EE56|nr:uncharacterized protein GGS25DRAFT_65341 [Hypoxylon fragiforme]KAI2614770.1 hypothetical protein GGS25DRAFT_65341 [Hypoxylon fragiforme]
MGRTEPSHGRPPPGFRRDVRAKRAKATVNKTIPAMLAAHPRARRGVEGAELVVDPPVVSLSLPPARSLGKVGGEGGGEGGPKKKGKGGRGKGGDGEDEGRNAGGTVKEGKGGRKGSTDSSRGSVKKGPRISLRVTDTLTAAYSLLLLPVPTTFPSTSSPPSPSFPTSPQAKPKQQQHHRDLSNTTTRVAILNMASPLSPGGGFLNGAAGQVQEEAALCARTTLFPSLRDAFYRLPELGVVWTRDVLVFRGNTRNTHGKGGGKGKAGLEEEDMEEEGEEEEGKEDKENEDNDDAEMPLLPKPRRWFLDVATAAMLRHPDIEVDPVSGYAQYTAAADRELAIRKMRAVMRVFVSRGAKRIVLGAWGCGVYGNPVGEVARAWRRVLLPGGGRSKDKDKDEDKDEDEDGSEKVRGKGGKVGKGKNSENNKKRKPGNIDSWDQIEEIVFAIKDPGMARAFATAFGEGLIYEGDGAEEDGEEEMVEEEEEEEDKATKELLAKIQELQIRVEQARTPQLRDGLNAVLVGLKSQLPMPVPEANRSNVGGLSPSEDQGGEDTDEDEDEDEDEYEDEYEENNADSSEELEKGQS